MSSRLLLVLLTGLILWGCGDEESQSKRSNDPEKLVESKETKSAEQEADDKDPKDDAEKLAKEKEEQGLTNNGSPLIAIELSQGASIIPQGAQTFWLATAVYEDETERDVTTLAEWGSTDAAIISVLADDPGGVFAEAQGSASVTAKIGEVSTSKSMTVIP